MCVSSKKIDKWTTSFFRDLDPIDAISRKISNPVVVNQQRGHRTHGRTFTTIINLIKKEDRADRTFRIASNFMVIASRCVHCVRCMRERSTVSCFLRNTRPKINVEHWQCKGGGSSVLRIVLPPHKWKRMYLAPNRIDFESWRIHKLVYLEQRVRLSYPWEIPMIFIRMYLRGSYSFLFQYRWYGALKR